MTLVFLNDRPGNEDVILGKDIDDVLYNNGLLLRRYWSTCLDVSKRMLVVLTKVCRKFVHPRFP